MKPGMLKRIPAITLTVQDAVTFYRIETIRDAAEALLNHWPVDDGEEYLMAIHACVDAIHGRIGPDAVRDALVKAAEEAGVSVLQ